MDSKLSNNWSQINDAIKQPYSGVVEFNVMFAMENIWLQRFARMRLVLCYNVHLTWQLHKEPQQTHTPAKYLQTVIHVVSNVITNHPTKIALFRHCSHCWRNCLLLCALLFVLRLFPCLLWFNFERCTLGTHAIYYVVVLNKHEYHWFKCGRIQNHWSAVQKPKGGYIIKFVLTNKCNITCATNIKGENNTGFY